MDIDTSTTEYAASRVMLTIGSNQREWWTDGDIISTTRLDAHRVREAVRVLSHRDHEFLHSRGIGEAKGWKLTKRGQSAYAGAVIAERKMPARRSTTPTQPS